MNGVGVIIIVLVILARSWRTGEQVAVVPRTGEPGWEYGGLPHMFLVGCRLLVVLVVTVLLMFALASGGAWWVSALYSVALVVLAVPSVWQDHPLVLSRLPARWAYLLRRLLPGWRQDDSSPEDDALWAAIRSCLCRGEATQADLDSLRHRSRLVTPQAIVNDVYIRWLSGERRAMVRRTRQLLLVPERCVLPATVERAVELTSAVYAADGAWDDVDALLIAAKDSVDNAESTMLRHSAAWLTRGGAESSQRAGVWETPALAYVHAAAPEVRDCRDRLQAADLLNEVKVCMETHPVPMRVFHEAAAHEHLGSRVPSVHDLQTLFNLAGCTDGFRRYLVGEYVLSGRCEFGAGEIQEVVRLLGDHRVEVLIEPTSALTSELHDRLMALHLATTAELLQMLEGISRGVEATELRRVSARAQVEWEASSLLLDYLEAMQLGMKQCGPVFIRVMARQQGNRLHNRVVWLHNDVRTSRLSGWCFPVVAWIAGQAGDKELEQLALSNIRFTVKVNAGA